MEKITLKWNPLTILNEDTIKSIDNNITAAYRLSYKHKNGNIYVFYVGESTNLKDKLLEFLNSDENQCIENYIKSYVCYFRYTEINETALRIKVASKLYKYYQPACGEPLQDDEIDIEININ